MRFNCGDFNNSILLLNLQETHQERIGEDEFLFAESEFDVDKFLILVTFYNGPLPNFLCMAVQPTPIDS